MNAVIIDYGSGNLRSVAKAFEHVGKGAITVSSDAKSLETASHIVLPGVGAYGDCVKGLKSLPGMWEALNEQILYKKKQFLGICVGMQMMFEHGHEHGIHEGLGWLFGEVVAIEAPGLKIPHMGWNELNITQPHPILKGIDEGAHAYFVHSYHAKAEPGDIIAAAQYGQAVTAVVAKDHMTGTQFHPEKSQRAGLKLIENFLSL